MLEDVKLSTAALAIGAAPADVRRLIAAGSLPGTFRVGRRVWRVPDRSVFDFLAPPGNDSPEA